MKTTTTHPRKRWLTATALTLTALAGALGLSSCSESTREAYACSTEVTIDYPKPIKLTDFAKATRPRGALLDDWRQLIIETNHLYADTFQPGEKVKLPQACKKV